MKTRRKLAPYRENERARAQRALDDHDQGNARRQPAARVLRFRDKDRKMSLRASDVARIITGAGYAASR